MRNFINIDLNKIKVFPLEDLKITNLRVALFKNQPCLNSSTKY